MNHYLFCLIFLLLTICGCKQKQDFSQKILVQRVDFMGEDPEFFSYSLIKNDSLNFRKFHYVDSTSYKKHEFLIRTLVIDTANFSYVIFANDTFRFKTENKFLVNKKNYNVRCYIGDTGIGADRGLTIYLNDKSGILLIQSMGWGTKFIFKTDSINNRLINQILTDTSGFILSKNYENKFFKNK